MRYLLVLMLLAGCVSHSRSTWTQEGKTDQDMKQDLYACDKENRAVIPVDRGTAINRCMEARGWR